MKVVLDAGALIAVDRRDRRVGAMLRVLQQRSMPVHTSAAVVTQVWRDGRRQVNLTRILAGVEIAPLDEITAKRVGELLATSRTSDLADAHVAWLVRSGDVVLTSDVADIAVLLRARSIRAEIVAV